MKIKQKFQSNSVDMEIRIIDKIAQLGYENGFRFGY